MKYQVILTPTAIEHLTEAFRYIHQRAPLNAARWLKGIYKAIDTLETFPRRCPAAREAEHLNEPLRQLIFKSHRVIFLIDEDEKIVRVLYVRHGARRAIGEPEDDD